jgi:putative queuosine salvage protein
MAAVTVAFLGVLTDRVRLHCAGVASTARHVSIATDAEIAPGGISGLDDTLHFLDGSPEDVARYVLILDTINFGSGWFGELQVTTDGLTARLTAHARAEGPWTASQLRALDAATVAATLGLPGDHQLTRLYSAALNHLGGFLGHRPMDRIVGGSAEDLAERLAGGMPFFDDRGYYKRAQIAANDLHLAGVVAYPDIDRLTIFADNLVPHVLRLDGVLRYSDELAHRIDAGLPLTAGGEFERELRGCAVHACERIAQELGVAPRLLDNWLWNRGAEPPYSERPAHITHTVYY